MGGPFPSPSPTVKPVHTGPVPFSYPFPVPSPPPLQPPPPRTVPLCRPMPPPPPPTCSVALPDLRCRLGAVLGRHSTGLAFRDRPKTQREACPTPIVRIHAHCTPFPPSPRARPAPFGHIAGAMPVPHPKSVPAKTAAFCASRRARARLFQAPPVPPPPARSCGGPRKPCPIRVPSDVPMTFEVTVEFAAREEGQVEFYRYDSAMPHGIGLEEEGGSASQCRVPNQRCFRLKATRTSTFVVFERGLRLRCGPGTQVITQRLRFPFHEGSGLCLRTLSLFFFC